MKRHLSGWRPDRPDHRDYVFGVEPSIRIPSSAQLPNRPVREEQDWIGSCVACAATSAMEYLYLKAGKVAPQFSRLFAYYATRVWVEGYDPAYDHGCSIRQAMKALAQYGTCLESVWPYIPEKYKIEPSQVAKSDALFHKVVSYYTCPEFRLIKLALAAGYPVVCGFSVPESMLSDECTKTGIVKFPEANEPIIGGHAILLTSYDDVSRHLGFENSWGAHWGMDGRGVLPYEYATTGLALNFTVIKTEEGV